MQAASYFVIGGLGTEANPGKGAKVAITAMFTLFYLGFVFGWGPIYHIISAEVPSSSKFFSYTYLCITGSLEDTI